MPAHVFDLVNADPPAGSDQEPKRDAIEQGADFAWGIQFRAADVQGTVASDWLVRMQIRRAYADRDTGEPLVSIDSDAVGGITTSIIEDPDGDLLGIDIHIDDTVTAQLPLTPGTRANLTVESDRGLYFYDVELERTADGYVRRLVQGRTQVVAEVTR